MVFHLENLVSMYLFIKRCINSSFNLFAFKKGQFSLFQNASYVIIENSKDILLQENFEIPFNTI
jgi:hypothetical protein